MRFRGVSTLSNIDVSAATAFAGRPDTISGRLSGRIDFSGRGADPASVMRTVRGNARVDIVDGTIKNLGLLNTVVVATSMRAGSLAQAAATVQSQSNDEPFSKLGATLMMADGSITTDDLRLESKDLLLSAAGIVCLAASTIDLKGRVQLSDELSQQAGRDLIRYTQDQGRVTLPATITGSIGAPTVRIDAADMAKRALAERRRRAEGESEGGDQQGAEKEAGRVVRAMISRQVPYVPSSFHISIASGTATKTPRHEKHPGGDGATSGHSRTQLNSGNFRGFVFSWQPSQRPGPGALCNGCTSGGDVLLFYLRRSIRRPLRRPACIRSSRRGQWRAHSQRGDRRVDGAQSHRQRRCPRPEDRRACHQRRLQAS